MPSPPPAGQTGGTAFPPVHRETRRQHPCAPRCSPGSIPLLRPRDKKRRGGFPFAASELAGQLQRLQGKADPALNGEAREGLQPVGKREESGAGFFHEPGERLVVSPPQGYGGRPRRCQHAGHVFHEEGMAEYLAHGHRFGGQHDGQPALAAGGCRPDAHEWFQVHPAQAEEKHAALDAHSHARAQVVPRDAREILFQVAQGNAVPLLGKEHQEGVCRSGSIASQGCLQPLDGRHEAGHPRKVVRQEGKRFVELGPLRLRIVLGKVGAEGGKAGALEKGIPSERLEDLVAASCSPRQRPAGPPDRRSRGTPRHEVPPRVRLRLRSKGPARFRPGRPCGHRWRALPTGPARPGTPASRREKASCAGRRCRHRTRWPGCAGATGYGGGHAYLVGVSLFAEEELALEREILLHCVPRYQ